MKRKTKIIIFVVSTIISIIIILFSYFGVFRYIKLHLSSSEEYVKNYNKLERGDKGRVVISFTTLPNRINKIKPMLNSLLDQTVKVDQIALNVPYNHKGVKYNIPDEYKDIVNIFRVGKDYGPGTKIIPTLLREGECDTKIIYLDDNLVYGEDFIETLLNESKKYPNMAIYTRENMKSSGGVLIQPEFFNKDVINHEMNYFDDEWLRQNLKVEKQKIKYRGNYRVWNI